jgi:hypothetical protein
MASLAITQLFWLSKSHYDRRSVGQSVLMSRPIWVSWLDINFCSTFTVLSMSGLQIQPWHRQQREYRFHGSSTVASWSVAAGTVCCGSRCLAVDMFTEPLLSNGRLWLGNYCPEQICHYIHIYIYRVSTKTVPDFQQIYIECNFIGIFLYTGGYRCINS